MQKLLLSACAAFLMIGNACAAPSASRHTRVFVLKQTVLESGTATQSASIVIPTVQSQNLSYSLTTSTFGATEIPSGQANSLFSGVPRFDYRRFWAALRAVNACEASLSAQYKAWFDGYASSYASGDAASGFNYYYDPGSSSPFDIANNQMGASTYTAPPYPYNTFSLASCPYNPSEYSIAVLTRQSVKDYSQDSPEAIQFVTGYHLVRNNMAGPLKAQVINFLRGQNIEAGWIDLQFDIEEETTGIIKRVATTFMINQNDTSTTPGQYITTAILNPPGAATVSAKKDNRIDIVYVTYGQYPDIFHQSDNTNANYLRSNYPTPYGLGILGWNITPNTTPINPTICNGTTTCGSTNGTLQTNGEYDPNYGKDTETGTNTIDNPTALSQTDGVDCLIRGGIGCRMAKHNVATLMSYSGSSTGSLIYYGRWELEHDIDGSGNDILFPPKSGVQEMQRSVTYNVCRDATFQNQIQVSYQVRRLIRRYTLAYTSAGISATQGPSDVYWEVRNVALPRNTTYSTVAGFTVPRSTATSVDLQNTGSNILTTYNQLSTDPPNTLGLSVNTGAVMVDPLIPREQKAATVYRPTGTGPGDPNYTDPTLTWSSKMLSRLSTTLYVSSSLPATHQSVAIATARTVHFDCASINEPTFYGYYNYQNPYNAGWAPYYPSGYVPGSVSITPGSTDGSPCSITYQRWTTGSYVETQECDQPPVMGPGGYLICPVPLKPYWTWTAGAVENTGSLTPACTETCELGGPVKICPRPY